MANGAQKLPTNISFNVQIHVPKFSFNTINDASLTVSAEASPRNDY